MQKKTYSQSLSIPPLTISTASHQSSTVNVLPLSHSYAFTTVLVSGLRHGERISLLKSFNPKTYIGAIKKHKVREGERLTNMHKNKNNCYCSKVWALKHKITKKTLFLL